MIIGCASDREIDEIKSAFCDRFEMKDLGKLDYFLGVNVVQNVGAGEVFINQSTYVRSLLEKFNFTEARPVKTPVDTSAKIATDEDSEPVDKTLYQSVVGSLLYLSIRPVLILHLLLAC